MFDGIALETFMHCVSYPSCQLTLLISYSLLYCDGLIVIIIVWGSWSLCEIINQVVSLYVCPCVYLSVWLYMCLSICLSVCLSVFLSVCLCQTLLVRLSDSQWWYERRQQRSCQTTRQLTHPSPWQFPSGPQSRVEGEPGGGVSWGKMAHKICLSGCLSVIMSICLSVCLYVWFGPWNTHAQIIRVKYHMGGLGMQQGLGQRGNTRWRFANVLPVCSCVLQGYNILSLYCYSFIVS